MATTIFGNQEFSSKNTSVNHKKIPYLVKHIDWKQFAGGRCLDFGSGKLNPQTLYEITGMGVQYLPYDPYWLDETTNNKAMNLYPTIVICSNLLNVIKENEVMHGIHNYIRGLKKYHSLLKCMKEINLISLEKLKKIVIKEIYLQKNIFIMMKSFIKVLLLCLNIRSLLFKEVIL